MANGTTGSSAPTGGPNPAQGTVPGAGPGGAQTLAQYVNQYFPNLMSQFGALQMIGSYNPGLSPEQIVQRYMALPPPQRGGAGQGGVSGFSPGPPGAAPTGGTPIPGVGGPGQRGNYIPPVPQTGARTPAPGIQPAPGVGGPGQRGNYVPPTPQTGARSGLMPSAPQIPAPGNMYGQMGAGAGPGGGMGALAMLARLLGQGGGLQGAGLGGGGGGIGGGGLLPQDLMRFAAAIGALSRGSQ
jgi:hypothetical protein